MAAYVGTWKSGVATVLAVVAVLAVVTLAGCGSDRPPDITSVISATEVSGTLDEDQVPDGAFKVLALTTPDGTGQVVHPDYAEMPKWPTSKLLVVTPYADSKTAVENPALFARTSDSSWSPFAGLVKPIASPPQKGYLSDPAMVAVPEANELWVYYRAVTDKNTIELIRTSDGVHFTPPRDVVVAPNHMVVSPTIVRRDSTDWLMYSVNAGHAGCEAASTTVEVRHSANGFDWTDPTPVALTQSGYHVWHMDVQWIPSRNEYWALYNVKTPGSCATPALYLATSPDGVNWQTYVSPVLERGAIPEFADVVYRSTFSYDPVQDKIRFWYSGARHAQGQWIWRTAFQRRSRASVFASIARKSVRALTSLAAGVNLPAFDGP